MNQEPVFAIQFSVFYLGVIINEHAQLQQTSTLAVSFMCLDFEHITCMCFFFCWINQSPWLPMTPFSECAHKHIYVHLWRTISPALFDCWILKSRSTRNHKQDSIQIKDQSFWYRLNDSGVLSSCDYLDFDVRRLEPIPACIREAAGRRTWTGPRSVIGLIHLARHLLLHSHHLKRVDN